MSAFAKFFCFLSYPTLTAKWNKPPYLKGWRAGFSLVYSTNIFENDAKYTRLYKALSAMRYFENINRHKYIYLGDISEPEDNSLRLVIEEAGVSEDEETIDIEGVELSGLRSIEVSDKSCIYEVLFESYIGYSVIDESYAQSDDYEVFDGRIFCIYSKSHYLDYISRASFASSDYPGPFRHYEFRCLNHIVNIVSMEEPKIKILSGRHLTTAGN